MHLKNVQCFVEKAPAPEYYPFNLEVLRNTRQIEFTAPVTFFVGENGAGKSTLLEAMAKRCGIHIWRHEEWTRCNASPYEKRLHEFIHVRWHNGPVPGAYFDSELSRHFAEFLDEWAAADPGLLDYFGGQSLLTQSHGQSLMAYFKSRYRVKGLYLLDEPETALSPKSLVALLNLLQEFGKSGHSQFVIATHSPILMACPGAVVYSFDGPQVMRIDWKETGHYQLYKAFMEDPDQFLEAEPESCLADNRS